MGGRGLGKGEAAALPEQACAGTECPAACPLEGGWELGMVWEPKVLLAKALCDLCLTTLQWHPPN